MESFTLLTESPMDGLGMPPGHDDHVLMTPVFRPADVASHLETLDHADELAGRAIEAVSRNEVARAGGDFERSLTFYVSVTTQIAGLAINAHAHGDEVRAAALTSQAVLLLRQLPVRARIAVSLLRAATADADGPDLTDPLRFIAERALRRPEACALLGVDVLAQLSSAIRAAFTESSPRFESRISRVHPSTQSSVRGTPWVPQSSGAPSGHSTQHSSPPPVAPSVLSGREREVVCLIAEGLTNRGIGGRLGIKGITVNTFVSRIFGKLGVDNRAAAAAYAVRNGLCDTR